VVWQCIAQFLSNAITGIFLLEEIAVMYSGDSSIFPRQ